jgi:hypothetical protein
VQISHLDCCVLLNLADYTYILCANASECSMCMHAAIVLLGALFGNNVTLPFVVLLVVMLHFVVLHFVVVALLSCCALSCCALSC